MNNEFKHYTVMKNEAVDALECQSGKIYVDGTLGGGGHSELILQRIQPDGMLFSLDVDEDAVKAAGERLKNYKNLRIIKDSYTNIKEILHNHGIEKITGGVLLDLGASYHQLTCAQRGFSFSKDAPLDMRFDKQNDFCAFDVVNDYKEEELVRIFSEYGEERFSKTIARNIISTRKNKNIETTFELAELIKKCTPRINSKIHPATRVFQAIRIEVNQELQNINKILFDIIPLLNVGAIISVISFHSLEDRVAKQVFRVFSAKCRCEKNQPVCNCRGPEMELVNKKPITATDEEIKENPPSRSAKLRIARKI